MQIESSGRRQQPAHHLKSRIEHVEILGAVAPGILVALDGAPCLWSPRVLAASDPSGVGLARKEGWVGVDQVDAAFVLLEQGRHDRQVLAQDESIPGPLAVVLASLRKDV